ncbi:MAG TPA: ribosome biogenesis GTP-binding protein YihA/YsxC [Kiloniellales bacterium]|nr:ribosome biogenesis GTP-binding protein YihA/YsxC [Kiloniellales bacterium]
MGSDEAGALEFGRWLFAQDCRFVAGAATEAALPPGGLPEVAFAGRSNVGKSSLVNALTGRKTLAHVSRTPGRTQQLNFFELGRRLLLVDLPGYGYAKVSKSSVASWQRLIERYLKGRAALRRVLVLLDTRHGLKEVDRGVLDGLDEAAQSYQVVLTKADLAKPAEQEARLAEVATALAKRRAAHPVVHLTSAASGQGIEALRAELAALSAASARR